MNISCHGGLPINRAQVFVSSRYPFRNHKGIESMHYYSTKKETVVFELNILGGGCVPHVYEVSLLVLILNAFGDNSFPRHAETF